MTGSGDLLDRLTRRPATTTALPADDPEAADDRGAFGLLRGTRDRAVMIDFRLRTGERVAFPYAALERVTFDPAAGLTLAFLGGTVRLAGRNLAAATGDGVGLLDGVHRQRVTWVQEGDAVRGAFRPADATVVSRIDVEPTG